jgi:hypothetical protein
MSDLNSTTLARTLSATDRRVQLASIANVAKDDLLVIDREAMLVLDVTRNPVRVLRGAAGTAAVGHATGQTAYSGTPDQFYHRDPVGIPAGFPVADPWINLREGRVWVAQGDEVGPGAAHRRWQLQSTSYPIGPFGIPGAPVVTP